MAYFPYKLVERIILSLLYCGLMKTVWVSCWVYLNFKMKLHAHVITFIWHHKFHWGTTTQELKLEHLIVCFISQHGGCDRYAKYWSDCKPSFCVIKVEDSCNEYGVVMSCDHFERTCQVKWLKPYEVGHGTLWVTVCLQLFVVCYSVLVIDCNVNHF